MVASQNILYVYYEDNNLELKRMLDLISGFDINFRQMAL